MKNRYPLKGPLVAGDPGMDLEVLNPELDQAIIYVGEQSKLAFTFTNDTGDDVTLISGDGGSTMEFFMPSFFEDTDLQNMSIVLPDWQFAYDDNDESLMLTYTGSGQTLANGQSLAFTITGVESTGTPATSLVKLNPSNFGGNVSAQYVASLTLATKHKPGNANLKDVLQVSLDNQGSVIVSPKGDPLQNTLTLNFKNTVPDKPLYRGKAIWAVTPQVQVSFVYGSTSGALAPDNDPTKPALGSAWNIAAAIPVLQNAWFPTQPDYKTQADPLWLLKPSNTNVGIIGTGENANVTITFNPVISFTPPGNTQMTLLFTGFMQDETTKYDDAVYVLNIVKQPPPPTRGLMNFFSRISFYPVTQPTQKIPVTLNWTLFDVASVTLLSSYPGMEPKVINYPNPQPIITDSLDVVLPGTVQSTAVTFTLQAYDGNGGYLNSQQYTVFVQANMFVDPRDGKVYPVMQVGTRVWMAQNLDYQSPTGSSFYGGSSKYEVPYGRLYTADAAQDNVPVGWRVPTVDDWDALIAAYGTPHDAYNALIYPGTTCFKAQLGGSTDNNGNPSQMGQFGFYWTSKAKDAGNTYYAGFSGRSLSIATNATVPNNYSLSLRYVRDVS